MSKKLVFLSVVLVFYLASALQATNIIWVSDKYNENGDALPDDIGWVDFLTAQGYTVDYRDGPGAGNGYWRTLDDAKIAELNAADIVIISRNSDSGSYANAPEPTQWNSVTAPLITSTCYLPRNSRWMWYDNSTLSEDSGTPTLLASDIHHPIFTGVTLDAQGQVDIYDQSVGSATVSLHGVTTTGNGNLVAKAAESDWTIIAEWEAGAPFYAGGTETPAGKRLFFGVGTREGNGQGRGEYNLNEEGQKLFVNAIEYMIGNLVRVPWVKAWKPDPADGAKNVSLPLFRWTPGDTAVFHDVYFGTTPELTEADRVATRLPMTLYFHVPGLTPGTTYYWRVDEVEINGTTHTGDVWSVSVAPLTAYEPTPQDGAKWVDPTAVTLTWLAGQGVLSHDVYFGTDETAVAEGTDDTFKGNQVPPIFNPGVLAADTTYYWRVDEIAGDGSTRTGDVWSFETLGEGGGLRGTYYANTALSGVPVVSRIDPQINFNWGDNAPEGLTTDNFSVRWSGELDVPFSETYTFYANTEDGVRLWVDDVQLLNLWQNRRSPTEVKASIALEGGNRYPITMEFYDAGGVAVSELRWESPSIAKALIPQPAFSPPLRASSPVPANGAVDVPQSPVLIWSAGELAAEHDVYFGQDAEVVANATTADAAYQGRQALESTTFEPGELQWNTTYYWRIDQINAAEADSPWEGSVWSFTAADFIVVDDFENYTDNMDDGEAIFQTWIDGLETGNGSLVGYLESNGGTFGETVIVHGGDQAMPFDYNNVNSPWYSEAYREFSPVQDWTIHGVTDLKIWYQGAPIDFVETAGTITMSASGADIWNTADEFRFAYKPLNGNGAISARVDSIENTNGWAKGGVMIRESLDPSSKFLYAVATPSQGVSFGWRAIYADTCNSATIAGISTPQYVRLTREGNVFTAQYSADGTAWTDVTDADGVVAATTVAMPGSVLAGLCVTSHNATAVTTAVFADIQATGVVGGWQVAEVGVDHPGNSPDDFYVIVEDSTGAQATVVNPDPAAVNIGEWTEWAIPLSEFAGVNLTRVKRLYLGVGDSANPTPAGAGRLYIDDIRVTQPAVVVD